MLLFLKKGRLFFFFLVCVCHLKVTKQLTSVTQEITWFITRICLQRKLRGTQRTMFEHSLALPFFGIGMKTDTFQSCGPCWVFQIFWHIECSTFTPSSFRIWNSSTGIPSPPLALFVVMLSKAHLTSHSRMSDSRWVITPSLLSWSWRSFVYSSSVYSCHLVLISSTALQFHPTLFGDLLACSLYTYGNLISQSKSACSCSMPICWELSFPFPVICV